MTCIDVARATEMRNAGATLASIGAEFGVTGERVRQIVGSKIATGGRSCECCAAPFSATRADRRYCSTKCRQRAWDARQRSRCIDCQAECNHRSARCVDCALTAHDEEREKRWARIAELWAQGLPIKEMALAVGFKNANVLSGQMARMKHAGWDLPPRRKGWTGRYVSPPGPARKETISPATARSRYASAVRSGKLARADACERCGREGHVDGHHHDLVGAPLEVEWLCRSCHVAHHKAERRALARVA